MKQRLRLLGEHRNWRIVAHCADGIKPGLGNWQHGEHPVFIGPAKDALLLRRVGVWLTHTRDWRVLQLNHLLFEPLLPRPIQILVLDLLILQQNAAFGIQQQHLVRAEASAANHLGRRNIHNSALGGEHKKIALREHPARGAETVSIQHRANLPPVGEAHGSRAVPRRHEARGIAEEFALVLVHGRVLRPRAGHHHKQRLRERATGDD